MTNKIIEAARAAGFANQFPTDQMLGMFERFYAIAYQQGMEHLASEAIDTVARHGGSVEIEAAIRALPSQQDHIADVNKMVDRHTLQAQGKHPAPCARFCEANAFRIEERQQARLIAELEAKVKALSRDAERLNWIEREYVQVDTFAMPTGGDDADVGWTLKEWHEGECVPRLIHRHYRDDLREAIDAAIAAQKDGQAEGEPPCSPS